MKSFALRLVGSFLIILATRLPALAGEPCLDGTYIGSGTLNGTPLSFIVTFTPIDYNVGSVAYDNGSIRSAAPYIVDPANHTLYVTIGTTTIRGRLGLFHGALAHAIQWETAEIGFVGNSVRIEYRE